MSSDTYRCNRHSITYCSEFCPSCLNEAALEPQTQEGRPYKLDGVYYKATCNGLCGLAFGCEPQWQPAEIARMSPAGKKPFGINRLPVQAEASGPNPGYRRHKTSAERKGEPIHSGVLMYFPDALAAIARLSKKANDKHNPGEPMGWSRDKSTDHMDCVTRHSLTREAVDPEMGEIEAVNVAWRALAELQLLEEKRLNAAGIMPYSGVTS